MTQGCPGEWVQRPYTKGVRAAWICHLLCHMRHSICVLLPVLLLPCEDATKRHHLRSGGGAFVREADGALILPQNCEK